MARLFDAVVFGAVGDLSLRKLMPSIFRAFLEGEFSEDSRIILGCRKAKDASNLHQILKKSLRSQLSEQEFSEGQWANFSQMVIPLQIEIGDQRPGWAELSDLLSSHTSRVRLFYLAVPPLVYGKCCALLSTHQLINSETRVVVEKPIGYDLFSARQINEEMASFMEEDQIYRIDHYLGKETVLNLLTLRLSNSLFGHFWNHQAIDHIQISISERVGLEGRTGFYDDVGALKDMVQNHLLQLLCLVAMESPGQLDAESIRSEKIKVLKSLRPLTGEDVDQYTVRGQYVTGEVDGKMESGYLEDLGVTASGTETFVAIKAFIDNWQWAKVPFYLRTGKRLDRQSAEIVVQFKEVAHNVYKDQADRMQPNRLIIQLQPEERLQLILMAKDMTQLKTVLKPVALDLNFTQQAGNYRSYAYKRLFLNAIDGNNSLFIHRDEVTAAWAWIDPISAYWQQNPQTLHLYRSGSKGPDQADELLKKDDREWIDIYRSH